MKPTNTAPEKRKVNEFLQERKKDRQLIPYNLRMQLMVPMRDQAMYLLYMNIILLYGDQVSDWFLRR